MHQACRNGDIDTVKKLLDGGAYINLKNRYRITPLHESCWYGHTNCAKLLIKHGADLDLKDIFGNTALDSSCQNNNLECSKLLVENGCIINKVVIDKLLEGYLDREIIEYLEEIKKSLKRSKPRKFLDKMRKNYYKW